MSDKEYFRMKNTIRNLMKGLIHHKDIEVLNAYSHSNRVLKSRETKTDQTKRNNKYILTISRDFND